jgi:hypothetical protein
MDSRDGERTQQAYEHATGDEYERQPHPRPVGSRSQFNRHPSRVGSPAISLDRPVTERG